MNRVYCRPCLVDQMRQHIRENCPDLRGRKFAYFMIPHLCTKVADGENSTLRFKLPYSQDLNPSQFFPVSKPKEISRWTKIQIKQWIQRYVNVFLRILMYWTCWGIYWKLKCISSMNVTVFLYVPIRQTRYSAHPRM